METLRKQKKNFRIQMKSATGEEKSGLHELWRCLKAKHSALSRAESARKRRSQKKKSRNASSKTYSKIRFPFSTEKKKKTLETHLRKTYSHPNIEIPLSETAGLVWPATPGEKSNNPITNHQV